MDWVLYDIGLRHERVKIINFTYFLRTFQSSQVLLFGKFCVRTKYMIPNLLRKAIQDQEH